MPLEMRPRLPAKDATAIEIRQTDKTKPRSEGSQDIACICKGTCEVKLSFNRMLLVKKQHRHVRKLRGSLQ